MYALLLQLNEVPYHRRRQRHVVELCDLEKEYALLHACLQLAQKSPQRSSHMASMSRTLSASHRADEVVGLLVDAGLFDVAVNICRLFDIKMDVVFEHLTLRSTVHCFYAYLFTVSPSHLTSNISGQFRIGMDYMVVVMVVLISLQ